MGFSSDLFLLVKNLNANEKSYFVKHSRLYGDKDKTYMYLFEVLQKMESYDEEKVKDSFSGAYSDNLSMLKKQLYDKVLSALNQYTKESGNENLIFKWLEEGKILQKKGFVLLAYKKFSKALEYSIKYERFALILNIFSQIKTNVIHRLYENYSEDEIKQLLDQEKFYSQVIQNIQHLNNLQFQYYYYESIHDQTNMSKIAMLDDVLHWERYNSFVEKSLCLNILGNYAENIRRLSLSQQYIEKNKQLFDNNNLIQKEYYFNYILQQFNLISILLKQNKLNQAEVELKKQEIISPKKSYIKLFNILYFSNCLLLFCKKKEVHTFEKEFQSMIDTYRDSNQKIPAKLMDVAKYYQLVLWYDHFEYKKVITETNLHVTKYTKNDTSIYKFLTLLILSYAKLNDQNALGVFLTSYKNEIKKLKSLHSLELHLLVEKTNPTLGLQKEFKLMNKKARSKNPNFDFLYPLEISKEVDLVVLS